MKTILASDTMDIPEGVKVRVKAKVIEVEEPHGKLTRNFKHLNLDFELTDGGRKLKVDAWFGSRKSMSAVRTAVSYVQNLIAGVTKGFRNFLGEKKVQKVDMLEGVIIVRSGKVKDEIIYNVIPGGLFLCSQKCHVKNKDIRRFLHGIYVSGKGTMVEEQ